MAWKSAQAQKAYDDQRTWIHRMQAIEYLGGVCRDCGYKDNLNALEFDHVTERRANRRTLAAMLNYSWMKIQAELDKCELVCANCHRIRTASRPKHIRAAIV